MKNTSPISTAFSLDSMRWLKPLLKVTETWASCVLTFCTTSTLGSIVITRIRKCVYDVENPDDLDQFSTVVVVIYNSNRFSMETQYLVDKQALNQAELEAAEEGEPV